ncbi:hypothetical protein Hanom_Chr07g00619891 [Helianthus anomalus]
MGLVPRTLSGVLSSNYKNYVNKLFKHEREFLGIRSPKKITSSEPITLVRIVKGG